MSRRGKIGHHINKQSKGKRSRVRQYGIRARRLAALGFASYADYRSSNLWKERRQRYLAIFGNRCEVCETSSGPIFLHHVYYDRLGAETNGDLVLLCERCHDLAHRWPHFGPKAVDLMRKSWLNCGDPSRPIIKREREMCRRDAQGKGRSMYRGRPVAPVKVLYAHELSNADKEKYGL